VLAYCCGSDSPEYWEQIGMSVIFLEGRVVLFQRCTLLVGGAVTVWIYGRAPVGAGAAKGVKIIKKNRTSTVEICFQ